MKRMKVLALAVLVGGGVVQAVGVGMSNNTVDMTYNEAQCVQHGAAAIKKAGFSQNFEIEKTSVYGDQEDYTALVRCAPDHEVAFFVVAGPDSDVASHYLDELTDAF